MANADPKQGVFGRNTGGWRKERGERRWGESYLAELTRFRAPLNQRVAVDAFPRDARDGSHVGASVPGQPRTGWRWRRGRLVSRRRMEYCLRPCCKADLSLLRAAWRPHSRFGDFFPPPGAVAVHPFYSIYKTFPPAAALP